MDFFEQIYNVSGKCKGRLLLYGLNEDTKKAMFFLAERGIEIDGFLDDGQNCGICTKGKIKFLSKPLFYRKELEMQQYTVIDVFGKNNLNKVMDNAVTLFESDKEIIIYGAGNCGRYLKDFFEKQNVQIRCFCDKNINLEIDGYKIISLEELKKEDKEVCVVVAVNDEKAAQNVVHELKEESFRNVFWIDSFKWTNYIWERKGEGGGEADFYAIWFALHCLYAVYKKGVFLQQ